MRVVITGATGNVGSSLTRLLSEHSDIASIVGIARRTPRVSLPKTEWRAADVSTDELAPLFEGADAVVHLAWLIQPSRDEKTLFDTNVTGSARVFDAAVNAGVGTLVFASSVGVYSPGPKEPVDEAWPRSGIPTSFYSRHKAQAESNLDPIEAGHPELRVVRLRPGLIFKGEAATGIRRLFAGPLLPTPLLRRGLIPIVPDNDRLVFQAVHTDDVARAYLAAITRDVRGAFNVASEPVIDPDVLAQLFAARKVRMSDALLRAGTNWSWKLRLQPTPPGWLDLALQSPLLDVARARGELSWEPRISASDALMELVEGMRRGSEYDTPPLARRTGGPFRSKEFLTGMGAR